MVRIRHMASEEIGRLGEIDRSEHVTEAYVCRDGKLELREVEWRIPRWYSDGRPEYSVEAKVSAWRPILDAGGTLFGAFEGELFVGLAIHRPSLAPDMDELAVLHVSRSYRGRGIGARLTREVIGLARERGAKRLYVSSAETRSTVDFYARRGFALADAPHPERYAEEPDDIHMLMEL